MSFKANSIYSYKGFMKTFSSSEFTSRENARKYSPFFDEEYKLVYWVSPSFDNFSNKLIKRSHFKHYPEKEINYSRKNIELSINKNIDKRHKKMQDLLMNILNEKISKGEMITWFYKDEKLSDFPISGDFLKYVESVQKEYRIEIKPLELEYCFDIVLLGRKLNKENIILGAIEIENSHEADFLKILVCKSLGFPLLTIDISEYEENEIDKKICLQLLSETTMNNIESRRRNYFYIHNLLLPVFIAKNDNWGFDDGHQYLIFMRNENDIKRFKNTIDKLKNILSLDEKNVLFQFIRINEQIDSSIAMQKKDIQLISQDIKSYIINKYIKLILQRPENSKDMYLFHIVLCKLLALHFDCIVTYKYNRRFSHNNDEENPIWVLKKFNKDSKEWNYIKYCPKQVSEPIFMIIEEIKKHTNFFNYQLH